MLKLSSLLLVLCLTVTFVPENSVGQTTNFVDKDSKLVGFAEPQWYKDNIPFVEVPDRNIEEVYYYRWSSHKRHLRYTVPGAGYVVTEFVHKVFYSQKFDSINAAAGHHIYESRWLRNPRYVRDYINFWTREGPAVVQYSEWIADAAFNAYLMTGDYHFIESQLQGLVKNYRKWDPRFDPELNLYFITPHDDAMEYSCSSVQTEDPYHGGLGYRPSHNAEMYANALAISKIARIKGNITIAVEFEARAEALRASILNYLWDDDRKFFYHMYKEDNPNHELLDSREEIGFFPWKYGVPDPADDKYDDGWQELFEREGFSSSYGPTTCESRSPWFDGDQSSQCCWWNGNSWPYSTGITIGALANQIKNYGITAFATVQHFVELLQKYALTQYKDGKPYVAECHSPGRKVWVCDSFNHSEHYAHSVYVDNVLGDLIGIEPQEDDYFVVNPLILPHWTYFIAENILYHGHNITVLYDRYGTRYNTGQIGLQVFLSGQLIAQRDQVERLRVLIPPAQFHEPELRLENFAANAFASGYPIPDASFTSIHASVWHGNDGRIFYDQVPTNRWTNYESPNPTDWYSIDFGRPKTFDEIKLYVYSDVVTGEGDCDCYKNVTVETWNGQAWTPVRDQVSTPATCSPNDLNVISFRSAASQKVRLVFTRDEENNYFVGFTELEIWSAWPSNNNFIIEAEDGIIQNAQLMQSSESSGGHYVGGLDQERSWLEFTGIWTYSDGLYVVSVHYANRNLTTATMNLVVNDLETMEIEFPPTEGWGQFIPLPVNLNLLRGNNVLIFSPLIGVVDIDFIHRHNFEEFYHRIE